MTGDELRRRRAAAQLLADDEARDPAGAVAHLLAIQAQDLRAARLALRARGAAARAADVDAALDDGALVVTWLMRGTIHLVAREDHGWLLALTADRNAARVRRRPGQLCVGADEADRAVGVIGRWRTARWRARSSPSAFAPPDSRPRARPCRICSRSRPDAGTIVQGPVTEHGHAFVLARNWLGPPARALDRDAALAELARRYLRAHGPATATDLAAWSGLGLRDARTGFTAIAGTLTQDGDLVDLAAPPVSTSGHDADNADPPGGGMDPVPTSGHDGGGERRFPDAHAGSRSLCREEGAERRFPDAHAGSRSLCRERGSAALSAGPPRLLPAFEPYLLGWRDRAFAVPSEYANRVHPGGGIIRATAVVDGRVFATWTAPGGAVRLEPFQPLDPATAVALAREAERVARF